MRIVIVGFVVAALIYLPSLVLNATLTPQVNAIQNYYANADKIAQDVAAGAGAEAQ